MTSVVERVIETKAGPKLELKTELIIELKERPVTEPKIGPVIKLRVRLVIELKVESTSVEKSLFFIIICHNYYCQYT